jgi:hypothetical protein
MAVRKICKQKGCRASPRCNHPWWFDMMHEGKRWRMPVDDFAIPRGATEPVTSKQTAEKVWEPKFLAEIVAGRNPRLSPAKPKPEGALTVADFLDQYFTNYVEAEGLKSADTIRGHVKQLKEGLGELPVTALEKPVDIASFKAQCRKGRALATVNRVLGVLRATVNWGRFQDPPLLSMSPFHRFGISIKRRDENKRDRRVHRDEEQQLLAACVTMNTAEHKWVGPATHDRIIGALETCCRQGEMLRIKNRTFGYQDNAAIPQHHRRGAAQGADRRVGTSPAVEDSRQQSTECRRTSRRRVEATGNDREPLRIVSHLSVGISRH